MCSIARLASTLFLVCALLPPSVAGQGYTIDLTGTPDRRVPTPFSRVVGLQPLGDSHVAIADNLEPVVVVVDYTSGERAAVGRRGQGPGEWQVPSRLLAGPAKSVWLVDPGKRVLHQIAQDAHLVRSIPWPTLPGEAAAAQPQGTDAGGAIFVQGRGFGASGVSDSIPIARWDPITGATRRMLQLPNPLQVQASVGGGGQFTFRRGNGTPFATRALWTGLPAGGVAVAWPDPYLVERVEGPGRRSAGEQLSYTPTRVTSAERNEWREGQAQRARQGSSFGGGSTSGPPAPPVVADGAFPETLPPFLDTARIVADPDGNVWIPRAGPAGARTVDYDIVHPGGGRMGRARLTRGSAVWAVDATHVHVVTTDSETGLQYVERFRR